MNRVTPVWKLEDAKARLSEVIRRARTEGPQQVTTRGRDAVFVIAAEELERALPTREPLLAYLESLDAGPLDLERDPDAGRDPPF
jgi:prevent-host-death family protein